MLKEIYIENLAVIEEASVEFCEGFNVFTGETGAGKSILLGGIKAILGGRASKDLVRSGAQKARISAVFTDADEKIRKKLLEYGFISALESDADLILSREIGADGKSAARINNIPATAAVLREIASEFIDIYGQHDAHTLTDNVRQRELLDNFGRLTDDLEKYAAVFKSFSELSRRIKKLQIDENAKAEKSALLKEKIDDVNSYKLTLGEEAETALRLSAERNAKAIGQNVLTAKICLSGDNSDNSDNSIGAGAIDLINNARSGIAEIADFLPNGKDLLKRLESARIELTDISGDITAQLNSLGLDGNDSEPGLIIRLEERASDLLRLKRKYKIDNTDELIELVKIWQDELSALESSEIIIEKLAAERKKQGDNLKRLAGEITEKRKKTGAELADRITRELAFLNMPGVRLYFDIKQEKVTVTGMDGVEIMISVNKGEEPKPLAKIASGGELSRIMLAIKAVLAETDGVPTMIFDEIDSGISGLAAQKVASKLAEISSKRQVLCVTHLASIAAKADKHLLIEKSDDGSRTYTKVADLSFEERKRELARIISGGEDEISIATAESLITGKAVFN